MTAARDPMIRASGVTKHYGDRPVLDGVDIEIWAGECFGLVGVNGAGKTTLIKCLLDFARADGGMLTIAGVDSHDTRARAGLAYLPERFVPPYYLTGADFLDYMAQLHRVETRPEARAALLRAVDLDPTALSRPVRQLSKGMTQKLGLMACLASGKPLLVLDEPMSGLDPRARAAVKQALMGHRDAGGTIFFSTHLLDDAGALCDRLAILDRGRVAFTGSPAECCRQFDARDLETAYLRCTGVQAA